MQARLSLLFQHSSRPWVQARWLAARSAACVLTTLFEASAYTSSSLRSSADRPSSLQIRPSTGAPITLVQEDDGPGGGPPARQPDESASASAATAIRGLMIIYRGSSPASAWPRPAPSSRSGCRRPDAADTRAG